MNVERNFYRFWFTSFALLSSLFSLLPLSDMRYVSENENFMP